MTNKAESRTLGFCNACAYELKLHYQPGTRELLPRFSLECNGECDDCRRIGRELIEAALEDIKRAGGRPKPIYETGDISVRTPRAVQ